jgi:hypothetical protein
MLRLTKKIELTEKASKGKKGIRGFFKISKHNYDYMFIENPKNHQKQQ